MEEWRRSRERTPPPIVRRRDGSHSRQYVCVNTSDRGARRPLLARRARDDMPPTSLAFSCTLHYITVHCVALRYFHSVPFRSIPLHSVPSRSIPFHSVPFHSISFHSISFHFISFHSVPPHSIPQAPLLGYLSNVFQIRVLSNALLWTKQARRHATSRHDTSRDLPCHAMLPWHVMACPVDRARRRTRIASLQLHATRHD